jgi:predicted anti-sigma-YlaC factor YlaD
MGRGLTCKELVELVTDYLEGALRRGPRRRFEAHLAGCDGCTRFLAQMRETIRLTGRLSEAQIPPEQRAVLLAAFRDWRG